ncbi:MAG: acyl-CoA reductase [Gammaproteobacteria bacterium]
MSAPLRDVTNGVPPALDAAVAALEPLRRTPPRAPLAARIDAFEALSGSLLGQRDQSIAGSAFLAAFLRRTHIEELLGREITDLGALDRFVAAGPRSELRILPRGAVCQWIAGNVPLLGVFSWALSAIFGNVNLLRVSSRNEDVLSPVVVRVAELSEAGREMAERTRVVAFERDNAPAHAAMSRFADLRVAWGGEEAVSAVRALPARWECDDLVFGPRRSFAVIDPAVADQRTVARLANDIVYFDQLACSSPQVVFVRGGRDDAAVARFVEQLGEALAAGVRQFRRHALDWSETYLIELDRQRAVLEGGAVMRDAATQWTLAVLERPVAQLSCANRFVQVVPFDDLATVAAALPANVQTVVMALPESAAREAAESLGARGVCRFPRPGMGNGFEIPWDGVAVTPRFGHFVTRAIQPGERADD